MPVPTFIDWLFAPSSLTHHFARTYAVWNAQTYSIWIRMTPFNLYLVPWPRACVESARRASLLTLSFVYTFCCCCWCDFPMKFNIKKTHTRTHNAHKQTKIHTPNNNSNFLFRFDSVLVNWMRANRRMRAKEENMLFLELFIFMCEFRLYAIFSLAWER